jgi:hypothetical protein
MRELADSDLKRLVVTGAAVPLSLRAAAGALQMVAQGLLPRAPEAEIAVAAAARQQEQQHLWRLVGLDTWGKRAFVAHFHFNCKCDEVTWSELTCRAWRRQFAASHRVRGS